MSKMSSMFVSGWDDDDEGVREKDLSDPKEQFLTAAEEGDVEKIKEMYKDHPELLHAQDDDKYTPLHRAAYNNHVEVCKWLLSVGADPELRTEDGWTALHCAACWSNFEVVGLLLSFGVHVNSRSNGGVTPLHLAINSKDNGQDQLRQIQTVKYLLEAPGIDMSARTGAGDTPLMLARRISSELTELLLRRLNTT